MAGERLLVSPCSCDKLNYLCPEDRTRVSGAGGFLKSSALNPHIGSGRVDTGKVLFVCGSNGQIIEFISDLRRVLMSVP